MFAGRICGTKPGRGLLLALTLLGGAWLSAPAQAQQEKLSVRLDFSPWGVQAALHLAQDKGWFKEAGLDVDIQDGRGSGNTLQLVNAKQVDVGQVQLGLLPQARANGATVKTVNGVHFKIDNVDLDFRFADVGRLPARKSPELEPARKDFTKRRFIIDDQNIAFCRSLFAHFGLSLSEFCGSFPEHSNT